MRPQQQFQQGGSGALMAEWGMAALTSRLFWLVVLTILLFVPVWWLPPFMISWIGNAVAYIAIASVPISSFLIMGKRDTDGQDAYQTIFWPFVAWLASAGWKLLVSWAAAVAAGVFLEHSTIPQAWANYWSHPLWTWAMIGGVMMVDLVTFLVGIGWEDAQHRAVEKLMVGQGVIFCFLQVLQLVLWPMINKMLTRDLSGLLHILGAPLSSAWLLVALPACALAGAIANCLMLHLWTYPENVSWTAATPALLGPRPQAAGPMVGKGTANQPVPPPPTAGKQGHAYDDEDLSSRQSRKGQQRSQNASWQRLPIGMGIQTQGEIIIEVPEGRWATVRAVDIQGLVEGHDPASQATCVLAVFARGTWLNTLSENPQQRFWPFQYVWVGWDDTSYEILGDEKTNELDERVEDVAEEEIYNPGGKNYKRYLP